MERKRSMVASTIGTICLFIGLFMGVPLSVYGLFITISTIIFSTTGYDATGLGIIMGPMMIGPGIVALCLLIPAVRLLNLQQKQIVLPVTIITLFMLIIGVNNFMSIKLKGDKERQKAKKVQEFYKLEDMKIQIKFENKKIVSVKFSLTYQDDSEFRQKINNSSMLTRKALNQRLATDKIFEPIGRMDMPSFRMQDNSLNYVVEVTYAGYEKLKSNKYAKWISLWGK